MAGHMPRELVGHLGLHLDVPAAGRQSELTFGRDHTTDPRVGTEAHVTGSRSARCPRQSVVDGYLLRVVVLVVVRGITARVRRGQPVSGPPLTLRAEKVFHLVVSTVVPEKLVVEDQLVGCVAGGSPHGPVGGRAELLVQMTVPSRATASTTSASATTFSLPTFEAGRAERLRVRADLVRVSSDRAHGRVDVAPYAYRIARHSGFPSSCRLPHDRAVRPMLNR